MPQPLSKVDSSTPILFHPKALSERPELAALIARAIAGWSEIEGQMSFLLVRLLGANAEPGLAMFSAITSAPAQIASVKAAAQSVLDNDRYEMLSAVLSIAGRQATQRHHLAHRIWGLSDDLPDALILADPKDLASYWMTVFEAARAFAAWRNPPKFDYPRDRIFVYRKNDLDSVIADMDEVRDYFYQLGFLVEPEDQWRDQILRYLGDKPRIQEALTRNRKPQRTQ